MRIPEQIRREPAAESESARQLVEQMPTVLTLDDGDSMLDVVDALAIGPFAGGEQPWSRAKNIDRIRADATLLPAGGRLIRRAQQNQQVNELAAGDGWTLHSIRWDDRSARVTVTATSDELAESILLAAIDGAAEPAPAATEDAVRMGFWHFAGARGGAHRASRRITTPPWDTIRGNYSGGAAGALEGLMGLSGDDIHGRLMLLHGPPGTGKTTALRSLAHAWRDWCQVDCVLDPEKLFGDSGYMLDLVLGDEPRDRDGKPRWRLLLLEDCDELIGDRAKRESGQALSRLLNLTDGLLGQGSRILVAISTNEDLTRLHPAVIRPGRCLAQIEVGRLSYAEALRWLADQDSAAGRRTDDVPVIEPTGATLAQLYAMREHRPDVTSVAAPERHGMYL